MHLFIFSNNDKFYIMFSFFGKMVKCLQPPPPHPTHEINDDNIPRYFYLGVKQKSQLEEIITCPICFHIMKHATALKCGHGFCNKCFEDWNKTSDTCPTCRGGNPKINNPHSILLQLLVESYVHIPPPPPPQDHIVLKMLEVQNLE